MKSKFLINPFVMYFVSFAIVLFFYSFGWSDAYPKLSWQLLLFLFVTMFVMLFCGYVFYRGNYFKYTSITPRPRMIKRLLIVNYLLLIVEFYVARTIPILGYLFGNREMDYTEFGLPFVHVIVANLFPVLAIYTFHCILSTPKGKERTKFYRYLFWAFLPAILIFNRGMMLYEITCMMMLYMMSIKSIRKVLLGVVCSILGILFLFGALGNLRTDTQEVKSLILEIGSATPEFKESWIPQEFFWAYLYIATPIGNLQYNMDRINVDVISNQDVAKYVNFELLPEIISKRIAAVFDYTPKDRLLVINALNASSVYTGAYVYLGWIGMTVTFCFTLFFIFVTLLFVPPRSPYFCTAVVLICCVVLFNVFNNMFTFMGLVPQLLFPIFMSIPCLRRIKLNE